MSRSGGMTTEISSTLTAAGLGVSTAVSIGGDAIIGSTYAELMPLFEADEQTEAIVIYTEPGGRMEAQLADWVAENDSRLPIVAFMAGRFMDDEEMKGMSFGHAGTIVEGKEDTATEKIARLEAAGIPVVERIDEIPDAVRAEAGGAGLMPGLFIDVEVADGVRGDAELAKKLEEVCPVDIYAATGAGVEIVEQQLDECVLCELCLEAAPAGAVRVIKLYDDGAALERTLSAELLPASASRGASRAPSAIEVVRVEPDAVEGRLRHRRAPPPPRRLRARRGVGRVRRQRRSLGHLRQPARGPGLHHRRAEGQRVRGRAPRRRPARRSAARSTSVAAPRSGRCASRATTRTATRPSSPAPRW